MIKAYAFGTRALRHGNALYKVTNIVLQLSVLGEIIWQVEVWTVKSYFGNMCEHIIVTRFAFYGTREFRIVICSS